MTDTTHLHTTVRLDPLRHGLREGESQVLDILLRVQAPDAPADAAPAKARPSQALALVIDRSGSMDGPPLDEALRCAAYVGARLRPDDRLALVQFDAHIETLLPASPVGDGQALRSALARIHAGGTTNLHGGWNAGAQALLAAPADGLRRVILLSDGCANSGLTDPPAIIRQVSDLQAQGVGTSTYGLGRHFNEDLMIAMARAGGGGHYYGDTAEDLREPFERECDLLANRCLGSLWLDTQPGTGMSVECLNDLPVEAGGGGRRRLPDLAWGAEAWAVLRVTVPAHAQPAAGQALVLAVRIDALAPDGSPVQLEATRLSLPVLGGAAWLALAPDERVQRRLAEIEASRLLEQMRAAAAVDDWRRVDALLAQGRALGERHEWLAGILAGMSAIARGRDRERLRKESGYSAYDLRSRLAGRDESASRMGESERASYLRRRDLQGKRQP